MRYPQLRYRKIKLEIQEVQGRNCLSDFHGMSLTRDKQMQMVRKWHTLIEAHTKVKTTDGYILRMFCMAFTKRRQEQVKNTPRQPTTPTCWWWLTTPQPMDSCAPRCRCRSLSQCTILPNNRQQW